MNCPQLSKRQLNRRVEAWPVKWIIQTLEGGPGKRALLRYRRGTLVVPAEME